MYGEEWFYIKIMKFHTFLNEKRLNISFFMNTEHALSAEHVLNMKHTLSLEHIFQKSRVSVIYPSAVKS